MGGTGSSADIESINESLSDIRQTLQLDGYELGVERRGCGELVVTVSANPDACEECLVPKELFEQMVTAVLPEGAGIEDVSVVYPTESR